MSDAAETTPSNGSLDAASKAITGLLSVKTDKEQPKTAPPEPVREAAEPKQAPAAPTAEEETPTSESAEGEGSEQASADEPAADEQPPQQPPKHKVKVDGVESEVTLEELVSGYVYNAHNTRKAQALADEKRTFEEGIVRVARERDAQYATHLDALSEAIKAAMPVEPDWDKLKGEVTSDVLASKLLEWKTSQKHLENIKSEQEKVQARQAEDAERQWRQHVTDEQTKLEAAVPELKDPEKARVIKTELAEFALSRGYTAEDLAKVTDHRLVLILRDAAEYQKTKEKAPKIANKIEKALETSAPGNRTTAPKANKLTEATKRLQKSGSVDDGAAAIAALLERSA